MTPEPIPFAVDLSNDGIFLWHRKPGQKWEFLGSVPLTSGNLRQQLEVLKISADDVEAPSKDAIVRIPTAEVHSFTITHDENAETSWEIQIVSELEKTSGGSIKELVFDIDRSDSTSNISVAWASMTVIEQAETFVHLIGFNPAYYTTDLDKSVFPRNPNFQVIDYHTTPEDFSNNTYELNETETVSEQPQSTPTVQNIIKTTNEFGLLWFIALFLVLLFLLSAIYFWPKSQDPEQTGARISNDTPIIAVIQSKRRLALKKVTQAYS